MPITALPPNAVRAIGSSQALSDSASVVKELLDNAIDARATRIFIEISANTLDDIRVKDNGYGIAPDDRAMICARYCTSKIRNLRDLDTVGGRCLGFRGEALASAAEMSGSLTITTRIEGEGTAVELKFDRTGQILNERRTSHPVGTSVQVGKFLQNLPVRRQTAEKMRVKMLAKVKRVLQAYALARPHLRLSLKILKAKDTKGDWTYPKSGALGAPQSQAVFGAATDIFGKRLTNECDLRSSSWSSTGKRIEEATSEDLGPGSDEAYILEAITAKPDCDWSILSNVGQYLSVDLRPVSCARGTLKQIISLYKSYLRSATMSEGNTKIVDPFLCLNITCSPGSYDANVEPAKDDVLFTNSESLLEIVEKWFISIYGEIQSSSCKPLTKNVSALKPHGIELLLARQEAPVGTPSVSVSSVRASTLPQPRSASISAAHTHSPSKPSTSSGTRLSAAAPSRQNSHDISGAISHSITEPSATEVTKVEAPPGLLPDHLSSLPMSTNENGLESSSDGVHIEGEPGWKGFMYTEDEDEDDEADLESHLQDGLKPPIERDHDEEEHLRDVDVSNPWAFAKLNAAMRHSGRNKQLHTPGRQIGDMSHSNDPSSDDLTEQADPTLAEKQLPRVRLHHSSPEAAYPTPSPFPFPQKARGKRKADDASGNAFSTPVPSNKERQKRGALDTWVQKSLGGHDEVDDFSNRLQADQGPPDLPYTRDFASARSLLPGGTPLSEIPDASQRPRRKPVPQQRQQGNIDKPFIPPVRDPNRVWFDTGDKPPQKRSRNPRSNNNHQDPLAAPTLVLRDDEIEDDESITPVSAQQSLMPIHPDLAITLDYEARKQKASEAHRKALREQAAAESISNAQANATSPLYPQHTTSSPHRNRQAKAIAALHTPNAPSPAAPPLEAAAEPAALEPSDPRAYLLRLHHRQGEQQAPGPRPRGKSRRQKTAMLPLETVAEKTYTGNLTLVFKGANVRAVEEDAKASGAWDRYVSSGKAGDALGEVGAEEEKRWEAKVKELVKAMYTGEEEGGERADLDVDFSKIGRAHAEEGYA